ncbi:alpha-1,3-mannosyl-glycoprotein 4-beta-N-acetylglucosaminyltransferase C-like [Saccostrea cucullata]|uniref:alpha-1,3-mannosyl-glycoprotein 4-beta-N-acetylglucosaminyltransferase C-like n=1 Tax=Saccostrea cuccullata TaxID=36930 RepID=UPI002ED2E1AC
MDQSVVDVFGFPSSKKVYLSIGIRLRSSNKSELNLVQETLSSILKNSAVQDRTHYIVVMYIPFIRGQSKFPLHEVLERRYMDFVNEGLIHVIRPTVDIYFDEDSYNRLYETNKTISSFDAKSNIDESFLYLYSKNLSKYFVELRPGSICTPHFFKILKQHVNSLQTEWSQIHFSENSLYGRLFHTDSLPTMAVDILNTYDSVQLAELLVSYKTNLQYQPPLFFYVDTGESANVTYYNRRDVVKEILKAKYLNPPAKFYTDMRQFDEFGLENVYDKNIYTFFWSNGFDAGSYITVSFRVPQTIKRIVVCTGSYINTDKLRSGVLTVGQELNRISNKCDKLTLQWFFIDGFIDTTENIYLQNIICLSVLVKSRQRDWLMLREILVEVEKETIKHLNFVQ